MRHCRLVSLIKSDVRHVGASSGEGCICLAQLIFLTIVLFFCPHTVSPDTPRVYSGIESLSDVTENERSVINLVWDSITHLADLYDMRIKVTFESIPVLGYVEYGARDQLAVKIADGGRLVFGRETLMGFYTNCGEIGARYVACHQFAHQLQYSFFNLSFDTLQNPLPAELEADLLAGYSLARIWGVSQEDITRLISGIYALGQNGGMASHSVYGSPIERTNAIALGIDYGLATRRFAFSTVGSSSRTILNSIHERDYDRDYASIGSDDHPTAEVAIQNTLKKIKELSSKIENSTDWTNDVDMLATEIDTILMVFPPTSTEDGFTHVTRNNSPIGWNRDLDEVYTGLSRLYYTFNRTPSTPSNSMDQVSRDLKDVELRLMRYSTDLQHYPIHAEKSDGAQAAPDKIFNPSFGRKVGGK